MIIIIIIIFVLYSAKSVQFKASQFKGMTLNL